MSRRKIVSTNLTFDKYGSEKYVQCLKRGDQTGGKTGTK